MSLIVLGLGAILASLTRGLACCPALSTIVSSSTLAIIIAIAFARGVPRGILTFRISDFVVGIVAGIGLRVVYGFISGANSQPFPSADFSKEMVGNWGTIALLSVIFAPAIEELFFRGLLLVTIFRLLRKRLNPLGALLVALFISAGAFLLVHLAFSNFAIADLSQLALVAIACGFVVVGSGRIWGAVILHATYNLTFLMLTALGTLLR